MAKPYLAFGVADNGLAESAGERQIFPLDATIDFAARLFVPLMLTNMHP